MGKVLITSSYPQFAKKVRAICQEQRVDAIVIETVLEDAVRQAKKLCQEVDIDVIISRAGTAKALSQAVSIPIVTAEASDFDILDALWKAKSIDSKIAYLGYNYDDYSQDFAKLQKIIGVQVKQFAYENSEQIEARVNQVKQEGFRVIVCGGYGAIKRARELGIAGFIVYSSERTILQAIKRAQNVINIRQKDQEHNLRLNAIISNIQDGIVSLDEKNDIMFINKSALKLLDIKSNIPIDAYNQSQKKINISEIAPIKQMAALLNQPKAYTGELVEKAGLILNSLPVQVQGTDFG
ncbi:MAG: PrpR N-terminal domain-containing protein, partial [Bacillota bacterium]|nr:PrpR N-terminal domain-containing protein [Bacillota bacterium]